MPRFSGYLSLSERTAGICGGWDQEAHMRKTCWRRIYRNSVFTHIVANKKVGELQWDVQSVTVVRHTGTFAKGLLHFIFTFYSNATFSHK